MEYFTENDREEMFKTLAKSAIKNVSADELKNNNIKLEQILQKVRKEIHELYFIEEQLIWSRWEIQKRIHHILEYNNK